MTTDISSLDENAVILWSDNSEAVIIDGLGEFSTWINFQQEDTIISIHKDMIPDLIKLLKQVKLKS